MRGGYSVGSGGGGAASFKNTIPGTERTVDATDNNPINTADPYYASVGSGSGRLNGGGRGTRGRVVLLVGGDATAFDTTYTTHSSSYAQSTIDSNSHDFVVEY